MPKRELLKVIQQLDKTFASPSAYDPNGLWNCSWEGKYGSAGTLDECIGMVSNYIDSTEHEKYCKRKDWSNCESPTCWKKIKNQVKAQCLVAGKAKGLDNLGGVWWSICWDGGRY